MKKIFLLSFLFFPFLLPAQIINKITVYDNSIFKSGEIAAWTGIAEGSRYYTGIADSAAIRVNRQLSERGYLHADFSGTAVSYMPDSSKMNLDIHVKEGNPTYIGNIFIQGPSSSDSARFVRTFAYQTDDIFNRSAFEENFSIILDYYEEKGYPFAKITLSSMDFYSDTLSGKKLVNIFLQIDPGRFCRIDRIQITGNTRTKDFVILRESRLRSGTDYSQKTIEEIPRKLDRLRFFEPVVTPSYFINSRDEGILSLEIKEKETNNFDGIVGYLPSDKAGGSGYLTGMVNVSLRNLFGTGRAAAFKWQQLDKNSQDLDIRYLEPWLLGYPFNINLEIFQQKQDTTYVRRRIEGSVEFLATENISASVVLASESVIPTENENSVFTVYNSGIASSGINLKIDTRNDTYAPDEGFYLLNSYSYNVKKINGPSKYLSPETRQRTSLQRYSADFAIYRSVLKNQVLALALHFRELKGDQIELSDLYRLGGTATLRGYRENQFLADRTFWSNLEFRQPLSRRSFAFLFYDLGYYLRSGDQLRNLQRTSAYKSGYGLGLNLETGLGILSVSYALANGDSFSQGKIHFGIINEF